MTEACKQKNNTFNTRLPVRKGMIMMLIRSLDQFYNPPQPYLQCLYKTLLITTYFGLLRIGEVTKSKHVVKAKDVQIGKNKKKLMFILRSSKTHTKGQHPQIIKIAASSELSGNNWKINPMRSKNNLNYCPFE